MKLASDLRNIISSQPFDKNDDSDIAAEACRQAILEAAAKALSWPQGDNPCAHFAGAYVAIWQIALASFGPVDAETMMNELWDWAREFAFSISDTSPTQQETRHD